ncbi:M1 family metallopeptidase [Flavobacteriales bacterium]|nr:M1 family metallopeptidase [Flavobacteriales bacterium]
MKKTVLLLLLIQSLIGTAQEFGRADSLRGYLSEYRNCYDVNYYHLNISVKPFDKSINGYSEIHFDALTDFNTFQIDLFENMTISEIQFEGRKQSFSREYNAVFISLDREVNEGENVFVRVYYSGNPKVAVSPPWDGGFSWEKDDNGYDWVGVSCQGLGASAWWPNKDHQSDEPDSMLISCQVPGGLQCISNGNLRFHDLRKSTRYYNTFHWFVSYPINNYDVSINIGDYTNFSDKYISDKDTLDLDYYVLSYNEEKAKKHFEQVKPMLNCFEKYFGPYPFDKDGYALVETPYLGMEHQSAIAYGNQYKQGYLGNTRYTAGLKFDYIIIHETGHEWWGNSITANDISDMWIQETFCTYSEVLFVECMYGYDAMIKYVENQMSMTQNRRPIVGIPDVHYKGSTDMYAKGSAMLHTLRNLIENDSIWFDIIMSMTKEFEHQTIDGRDVLDFINDKSGYNFDNFFEQYLYNSKLPELEYELIGWGKRKTLKYRWNAIDGFDMPVKVTTSKNTYEWIYPTSEWKELNFNIWQKDFKIARHLFLVDVKNLK